MDAGPLQNLTSADLICVKGMDHPVFTFHGVKGLDPRTLRGQWVIIDMHPYEVLRVETYALVDATGTSFGLMVKRAPKK